MISVFSILSSLLFLTFGIAIALLLGRNRELLASFGVKVIPLLAILSLIRVLIPVDVEAVYVINSYTILPALQSFFEMQVVGSITVSEALLTVWIAGTVIFLTANLIKLLFAYKNLNTLRLVVDEKLLRIAAELGLPDGAVLLSPDIVVPISIVFFRPKIYLPIMKLTDAEFRIVLRHERQHIVSGDSWVKLFYMVLAAALWWNPVVHIFREKLDDILEYRCDQAVLKGSSETERIIYTETLLTVARQAAAFPGQRKRLGAVGFLSSHPENTLITRTNLILRGKENYVVAKLISLVCIALFIGSYFVIWQSAYPTPDLMPGVEVSINAENSYLVHIEGDQYELWYYGVHVDTLKENEIQSKPFDELEVLDKGEER